MAVDLGNGKLLEVASQATVQGWSRTANGSPGMQSAIGDALLISIRSSDDTARQADINTLSFGTVHFYVFDDIDRPQFSLKLFSDEQADAIAKAVIETPHSLIICQCEAGISRSAGLAAAICCYFTGDDRVILDDRRYYPNQFVYNKMLEAFGLKERRKQ